MPDANLPSIVTQMGVDLHRSDVLRINLNMSFPRLPCQGEVPDCLLR